MDRKSLKKNCLQLQAFFPRVFRALPSRFARASLFHYPNAWNRREGAKRKIAGTKRYNNTKVNTEMVQKETYQINMFEVKYKLKLTFITDQEQHVQQHGLYPPLSTPCLPLYQRMDWEP